MINICIIHYNTPELTSALVQSINKFVTSANIYIFDNSDTLPFTDKYSNVTIFDNTQGQIINFEQWLTQFPNRHKSLDASKKAVSARHCISVDTCFDLINDNFILLDSDVLLTKDISELFNDKYCWIGEEGTIGWSSINRVHPFILYINVKICKQHGIRFFDKRYMHGLHDTREGDMYDTGSAFLIHTKEHNLPIKHIKMFDYIVHFGAGSYRKLAESIKVPHITQGVTKESWLEKYKNLWYNNIKKVLIVNYNTQKLLDITIKTLKMNLPNCYIYVFDNSDKTSFVNSFNNVEIIDNTKGQIINFDNWLDEYNKRGLLTKGSPNNYASSKHCISIEKALEIINDNVLLADSDIVIKQNIECFWDENYLAVGQIENQHWRNLNRLLPYLLFINYKKCKEHNIHFFDETKMNGLNFAPHGDDYDTGASFLEKLQHNNLSIKRINLSSYIEHYGAGSWRYFNNLPGHAKRINENEFINKNSKYFINYTPDNKEKIIVSLTSWKNRIDTVHKCINSILNNSTLPDKIILNLSADEFVNKENDLPDNLLELQKNNKIEIYWVKENTKTFKKIIPTLNRFKTDIIISIDDDILYPNDFIYTLINDWNNSNKKHPITAGNYIWYNKLWTHHGSYTLCKYEHFGNRLIEMYDNFVKPNINKYAPLDDQLLTYIALANNITYVPSSKILEDYKHKHLIGNQQDKITTNKIGSESLNYDIAIRQYIYDTYNINLDNIIDTLPLLSNKYNTKYGVAGGKKININTKPNIKNSPIIKPQVEHSESKQDIKPTVSQETKK